MEFNAVQKQAIYSDRSLLLVSAGAGSGKTRVLTERFVYLCEVRYREPENPLGASVDEIVAITFTEKAAREMKDRIRKRMKEKERNADLQEEALYWKEQQLLLEKALISTFHSFCQRLLAQYALQADLPPSMRVLDDLEATVKKRDILNQMFEREELFQRAYPLFSIMSRQQLLGTIEQLHDEIVELMVGEEVIEKLQVEQMLTTQMEAKKLGQHHILHSFHEQALACIASFPASHEVSSTISKHVVAIQEAFSYLVLDDPDQYMEVLTKVMPKRTNKAWLEQAPSLYELYEKHWKPLKESWKKIGGPIELKSEATFLLEAIVFFVKEFHRRYQYEKKRAGLLDFNDLQQKAVSLLSEPSIRKHCKQQFRHMMVDEFQDTNRLQLEVLERIDPYYQFIVGDQKQSIYRFRGANVRLMNEIEEKAKIEEDAEALLMNENYRTLAPIIEAINDLFASVMVKERTENFQTVYAPLIGHRQLEQDMGQKRVELMVMSEQDLEEESQFEQLANRMVAMVEDKQIMVEDNGWRTPSWGDMAILIPSRTNLLLLEQSLTKKNIPYVISGGVGFFERQEVIDFVTLVRWLTRPFEDIHLLAILRSPLNGLTVEDFFQIEEALEDGQALYELVYEYSDKWLTLSTTIQEAFERMQSWLTKWVPLSETNSLEDSLVEVFVDTGLRASLFMQDHGLQKVKNVEKVIQWMVDRREVNLEAILAEIDVRIELSEKEGDSEIERVQGDVVQIMTVHASKGLEFPIVFLPQLERALRKDSGKVRFHPQYGFVLNAKKEQDNLDQKPEVIDTPGYEIVKSIADAEAIEESKRLLYVAMTRARDYLYLIGNESKGTHTWLSFLEKALEERQLMQHVITSEKYKERYWKRKQTGTYPLPRFEKRIVKQLSLTVSEIMTFIHDPNKYYQRFVIGAPFDDDIDGEGQRYRKRSYNPSLLGTLVHRACELRDYGLSPKRAIEAALEEVDVAEGMSYKKEMERLMGNYSEEIRQSLGTPIANEWAFVTIYDDVEIIGEIDKIVEKDGHIHLYDFKTNNIQARSRQELLEYYKPQLYLYRYAYEKETKQPVAAVSLYLFQDKENPIYSLSINKEEEEKVFSAVRQLIALRRKEAGREEYNQG